MSKFSVKTGCRYLVWLALFIGVLFAYRSAFQASYQTWDDGAHSFEQTYVVNGDSQSFLDLFNNNNTVLRTYVPLTALSFFVEKKILGLTAFGSHFINLILHILVCVLVYRVSRRMGVSFPGAYITAVIFALHPIHVESVAWVSERKDVLYSIFYLAAILSYFDYSRTKKTSYYFSSFLFMILSLFSKSMALSLPLILLLIDHYSGRRINFVVLAEKIPFFIAASLISGITYLMNARPSIFHFPESILLWIWSGWFYIQKFFFPASLIPLYDRPFPVSLLTPGYFQAIVASFILLLLLLIIKNKWLRFGVLFYILSIFFLWRFDVYDNTIVADRFMYLPSLGFCLMFGASFDFLVKKDSAVRYCTVIIAAGLIALFLSLTSVQASHWKNAWTLWTWVLEHRPGLYYAHFNRAYAVQDDEYYPHVKDDFERFIFSRLRTLPHNQKHFSMIRSKMNYFRAIYGMRYHRAELNRGVWIDREYQRVPADYVYSLYGSAYCMIKDEARCLAMMKRALEVGVVRDAELLNMANYYFYLALDMKEALFFYNKILLRGAGNYDIRLKKGIILARLGRLDEALEEGLHLLEFDYKNPGAYNLLFHIFLATNQLYNAEMILQREMRLWESTPQVIQHQAMIAGKIDGTDTSNGLTGNSFKSGY